MTKGNQYVFCDVAASGEKVVRDLGDPVEVAERYYHQVCRGRQPRVVLVFGAVRMRWQSDRNWTVASCGQSLVCARLCVCTRVPVRMRLRLCGIASTW